MEAADSRPKILHEVLGMEFLPSEPGIVRSRLEVTPAVCQRFGFLSGGAVARWSFAPRAISRWACR